MVIIYSELSRRVRLAGRYIHNKLWPHLSICVRVDLPSWECYWRTKRENNQWRVVIGDWAPNMLLLTFSVVVLMARQHEAVPGTKYFAWWMVDSIFCLVAFAFALVAYERAFNFLTRWIR